jgi:CDP-glycerol glycerophosphotransferase
MTDTPAVAHDTALAARVAALEDLQGQTHQAVDQLVSALLTLQDQAAERAAHQALVAKVGALEQQLALERTLRDLAATSRLHPKDRRVVFVGTTYLGCNVKYAWLATRERAAELGLDLWWLPHHAEQQAQVEALGGRCLPAALAQWTPEHLHVALSAALVVSSDHLLNPNPQAMALLAGARHVQLWHGVSIKEIGLRNLPEGRHLGAQAARVLSTCGPYARLVGTAAAGEAEWRRWFGFAAYSACGYARNDVLYREPTEADLANVDRDSHAWARALRAQGRRVVLYAPTFRDAERGRWLLAAGLPRVAQALAAAGHGLLVALHPVEAPLAAQLAPQLPGVRFAAPRTDLYPLMAQADVLVTDYSSILFDWLHLDRPVLLFRPDHERYVQHSRKLWDGKLAAPPGPVLHDADALAQALCAPGLGQQPLHARARGVLRSQWFDHADGHSGQRLTVVLAQELALAGV